MLIDRIGSQREPVAEVEDVMIDVPEDHCRSLDRQKVADEVFRCRAVISSVGSISAGESPRNSFAFWHQILSNLLRLCVGII